MILRIEDETRVGLDGMAAVAYLLKDEHGNDVAEVAYPVELDIKFNQEKIKEFETLVKKFAGAPEMFEVLEMISKSSIMLGAEQAKMIFGAFAKAKGEDDGIRQNRDGNPVYKGKAHCGGCVERLNESKPPRVEPVWAGIWLCPNCGNNLSHQSVQSEDGTWSENPSVRLQCERRRLGKPRNEEPTNH